MGIAADSVPVLSARREEFFATFNNFSQEWKGCEQEIEKAKQAAIAEQKREALRQQMLGADASPSAPCVLNDAL